VADLRVGQFVVQYYSCSRKQSDKDSGMVGEAVTLLGAHVGRFSGIAVLMPL
jgi:fucose permease